MLVAYVFIMALVYIFTSRPFSLTVAAIVDAGVSSGVSQLTYYQGLVYTVYSICIALAVLIPVIIFVLLAMTTAREEMMYH